MKNLYILFTLLTSFSFTQQTLDDSLMHGGAYRTYKLYIPAMYSPSNQVPLLFNFHGYGSNSFEQMNYGDFRGISDTANFIIVHPQGTKDPNNTTYFNIGLVNGATDDIGFTDALINKLTSIYSIDQTKIYSTGMSNGGYMSLLLACKLSNRFAAVASVTGSMFPPLLDSCNAIHPTPIMQIHGTADGTVPYNGIANLSASIPTVLNFWSDYNNCGAPITTAVPNTNLVDGCTAEKIVYPNGDNCVEVIHYKVTGGAHTWPGTLYTFGVTNQDFNASNEIWKFFRKYDINGLIGCETAGIFENTKESMRIYPNPSTTSIRLDGIDSQNSTFEINDITGSIILKGTISSLKNSIDVSPLKTGHYFLKVNGSVLQFVKE